jgi:TolB-like protein/DNA-binding winged helix-turn-helix (wHTH) protein
LEVPSGIARFAEFELDGGRYELRRGDRVLKLEGIPMELLTLLVESNGQLVTRDQIIERIWGKGVFLDTEHGINTAIRKIRLALGDNPEQPRFVQTVTGKGYRFITPTIEISGGGNGSATGADSSSAVDAPDAIGSKPVLEQKAAPVPQKDSNAGKPSAPSLAIFGTLALLALAAALVGMNVAGWRDQMFARRPKPNIQALAVLPLANLSGDPEQEYFADGMTEALITELGKVSKPSVISRQSIMQYKGSKKPLQEIARELNVDAVLEGAVERSGDRVRVSVHLERVSPESQVWANEYSSNIGNVMGLEDDIARAISDEIQVRLTPDERIRFANRRPVKPEAHDDFLRAEFLVEKRNERDLQAGITYFKKAIENDPAYARAYAGLAWALVNLAHLGTHRTKDILPQARAAADKALELDPSMDEAHVSRAMVLLLEWNWFEAEKEHRLALTLAPNSWDAHSSYAWYLLNLGRFDEARAQIKYAEELDPVSPVSRSVLAYVDLLSGQTDLAIVSPAESTMRRS